MFAVIIRSLVTRTHDESYTMSTLLCAVVAAVTAYAVLIKSRSVSAAAVSLYLLAHHALLSRHRHVTRRALVVHDDAKKNPSRWPLTAVSEKGTRYFTR